MDFPQHSRHVLEQLNQQRQLGLLCDCTFVVDGVDFKAHKAVLAACSEYFKMLFVDQKDVVHLDISNAAGTPLAPGRAGGGSRVAAGSVLRGGASRRGPALLGAAPSSRGVRQASQMGPRPRVPTTFGGAGFDWELGGKRRTDRRGSWSRRTGSSGVTRNRCALPGPQPHPVAESVLNPYPPC